MTTRPPRPNPHQPPFARGTQLMELARRHIGCVDNADKQRVASPELAAPKPVEEKRPAAPFGMAREKLAPAEEGRRPETAAFSRAPTPAPVPAPTQAAPVAAPVAAPAPAPAPDPEFAAAAAPASDAPKTDDDLEGLTWSALETLAKSEGVSYKKGQTSRSALIGLIRQKRGA